MMKPLVAIVDYQMGNVFSVEKIIKKLGYHVILTTDKDTLLNADKLILPGVGHFGKAMSHLNSFLLIDVLNEAVLIKKIPILAICLGMQLMTQKSEEGNENGLGWIDGEVVKFNIQDKIKYKVPHTGWNQLDLKKECKLLDNIQEDAEFYFVHSYYFSKGKEQDVLTETLYEKKFISSFQKDNIFGVQFHPEKSHDAGQQLMKNFIEL